MTGATAGAEILVRRDGVELATEPLGDPDQSRPVRLAGGGHGLAAVDELTIVAAPSQHANH